jgi:hypothetical protein
MGAVRPVVSQLMVCLDPTPHESPAAGLVSAACASDKNPEVRTGNSA